MKTNNKSNNAKSQSWEILGNLGREGNNEAKKHNERMEIGMEKMYLLSLIN